MDRRHLLYLRTFARGLTEAEDWQCHVQRLIEDLLDVTGASVGAVLLISETGGDMQTFCARRRGAGSERSLVELSRTAMERVKEGGEMVVCNSVDTLAGTVTLGASIHTYTIRSFLVAPLRRIRRKRLEEYQKVRGPIVGVLYLDKRGANRHPFSNDDIELVSSVSEVVSVTCQLEIEAAKTEEILQAEQREKQRLAQERDRIAAANQELVAANFRLRESPEQVSRDNDLDTLLTCSPSPAMRKALAPLYSPLLHSSDTILLRGETGVGKEVVACAIHNSSNRRRRPFIVLDPMRFANPQLVAQELFGYAPGSFTGALGKGRSGLLLAAQGGTVFIDEFGDLPEDVQLMLLRVMQEKRGYRFGDDSGTPIELDVRFILATNRDLEAMIEAGTFRRDLYARVAAVTINIPPLRDRPEDIPFLFNIYRLAYNKRYNAQAGPPTDALLEHLQTLAWPHNIRDLQALVRNLVLRAPAGKTLDLSDLDDLETLTSRDVAAHTHPPTASSPPSLPPPRDPEQLRDRQKRAILEAIERHGFNANRIRKDPAVVRSLGARLPRYLETGEVPRTSLYKHMKRLGLFDMWQQAIASGLRGALPPRPLLHRGPSHDHGSAE